MPHWTAGAARRKVVLDWTSTRRHSLRDFDGHEVAELETQMWRSYYEHHPVKLFVELGSLLRRQYHLPFWRSWVGAFHAARAAVVFQRGHERPGYLLALPDLQKFYGLISQAGTEPFDTAKAAHAELESWIIHRQRALNPRNDLELALAELQSGIYRQPAAVFEEHAKARAEAMLLRDTRAESGPLSAADWQRIGDLLDRSWVSLRAAVAGPAQQP